MSKNKIISLLLCLALSLTLTSCAKATATSEVTNLELITDAKQTNYKTDTVQKRDIVKQMTTSASLQYALTEEIVYSGDTGVVEEMHVSRGDEVKKGDVILTLSTREDIANKNLIELKLSQEVANLANQRLVREQDVASARADIQNVSLVSEEIKRVNLENQILENELYYLNCETTIANLKEQLQELVELQKARQILAPFDGFIEETIFATKGDIITRGTSVAKMYSPNQVYCKCSLSSDSVGLGTKVLVQTGKDEKLISVNGEVVVDSNNLPQENRSEYMYVRITDPIPENVSGFIKMVNIVYQPQCIKDSLSIPREALNKSEGDTFVHILEDNALKKRFVEVGYEGDEYVWIIDGLEEGQEVIL